MLGMRGWSFFRFVEWPWLRRQIPPVAALIFMLCFTSFATVLSLGGGPQATTIELAIYGLSYDYDPGRAALLALVQMLCCLVLVLLSQRLSKKPFHRAVIRLQAGAILRTACTAELRM